MMNEIDQIIERGIGDNANAMPLPALISGTEDMAALVSTYLTTEYAKHLKDVETLLDEARALPEVITSEAEKDSYAAVIKRTRDKQKVLLTFQAKEKDPYLRGGQAVDQLFFGAADKLARRDTKARMGAADVLLKRLTDYDTRVLAEKQLAARREADRLAAEEQARLAAARALQEAEAAALAAAERARTEKSIEARRAEAETAAVAADAAKVELVVAAEKAEAAHIATLATPADIMRKRGDDGILSTMATEKYAVITDRTKLPKDQLWAYIPMAALEQAVRALAVANDYNITIEGASIGKRPKSQVR